MYIYLGYSMSHYKRHFYYSEWRINNALSVATPIYHCSYILYSLAVCSSPNCHVRIVVVIISSSTRSVPPRTCSSTSV